VRRLRWSQARSEKASGSGNVPVLNAVTSAKSIQVFNSHRPGMRIGKWSL
jgi:hypothetical protein